MENAWQYAKLYPQHADASGNPTQRYWDWAKRGWASDWADRYPVGRGMKPLCSLWNGEKLDYIEARKKIYIPLYTTAVRETPAWIWLQEQYEEKQKEGKDLVLWDFDGYDIRQTRQALEDTIEDPSRPMGHAFVLAMMLEGLL
jgi:hypothetical protein